jgi:hypothetical protein
MEPPDLRPNRRNRPARCSRLEFAVDVIPGAFDDAVDLWDLAIAHNDAAELLGQGEVARNAALAAFMDDAREDERQRVRDGLRAKLERGAVCGLAFVVGWMPLVVGVVLAVIS